jgi:putative ABC transport system permease protein
MPRGGGMMWFSGVRIALRALRVNKLRSILTMLGIIIGVGAVITMIAIGAGAQAHLEEQIAAMGSNLLVVSPGAARQAGVRLGAGSRPNLTEDDSNALQREIPDIEAASPAIRSPGQVVAGNSNWSTMLTGITPEFFLVRNWVLERGRDFDAAELSGAGKVVILGDTVARKLFGETDPIGQTVRIRQVPMEVIGLLQPKGQSFAGQDQDDLLLMPMSTARNRLLGGHFARQGAVGGIMVKVRDADRMAIAEEEIKWLLRQRHKIQPDQPDDFTVSNLAEMLSAREESSRTMTWLLAGIAAVSLLVGGIGIMNTMLVSVTERTREIGLRMAVGARPGHILWQFLIEAVTLAVLGGLLGTVLGIVGAHYIGDLAEWRVEVPMGAIVLAAGFSGIVGVFFGFYPAFKASRLLPIDALRYE